MTFGAQELLLFAVALVAATVNGGLGYGFSSVFVPVGLGVHAPRVLNPGLVLLEVLLNGLSLVLSRRALPAVWRRTLPVLAGLLPGIAVGATFLATADATVLKTFTYAVLLPLLLLQTFGARWPVRSERAVGLPFGLGLGVLYSATTISGPPLALMLNNQGLAQEEFRAAISLIRVVESSITLATYVALGLLVPESLRLFLLLLPAAFLGAPLGRRLVRHVPKETFRRICMGTDAVLVSAGLTLALRSLGVLDGRLIVAAVGAAAIGFLGGAQWQRLRARAAPGHTSLEGSP